MKNQVFFLNFLNKMYANIRTMNINYLEKIQKGTKEDEYGKNSAGVTF